MEFVQYKGQTFRVVVSLLTYFYVYYIIGSIFRRGSCRWWWINKRILEY